LDISLDQKNPTSAFIKVTLNPEDYQSDWDKKIKEYGKTAQIKGFRPGKVPFGMLKKMVGKSLLADLVFKKSDEKLGAFIKEQGLDILGEPIFDDAENAIDWDNPSVIHLSYELGMVEPFELKLPEIEVSQFKIKVTDKELQETIDNLKNDLGEEEALNQIVKDAKVSLEPVGVEEATERQFAFNDLDKELQKALKGKELETELALPLEKLLEKDAMANWLQLEADALPESFTFKITKISKTIPAEMDQAFFDKALGEGRVENEEQFKEEVLKIISANYQRNADGNNADKIFNAVIEGHTFDVPKDFLIRWMSQRNEKSSIQEETEKWADNEKFIRWEIITSKVIKDEKIEVSREEIVDRTIAMFEQQFGGSFGDNEEAKAQMKTLAESYLQRDNGKQFREMYNNVIGDKVMEYIKSKVKITEEELSFPEFLEKR
jgi:trigger factor